MIWLVVILTAAAAGVVQTVTGFGSVVTMMLVFPLLFDTNMIDAPALAIVINQPFCMALFWRCRKHLRLSLALVPTVLYCAASLVTMRFVEVLPTQSLLVALGVLLMALSLYFLLVARRVKLSPRPVTGAVCGGLAGASAGVFAIGGPPMALYFVNACGSPEEYQACMQFLFTVSGAVSLIGRAAGGILRPELLPYGAAGAAGILAGMAVGQRVSRRLNADRARTVVYAFVGLSGLILLLQHLI